MSHSYAQQTCLPCPNCSKEFTAEIWLIVDTNERPDLLEGIESGTLHKFTCPHCSARGTLRAPLLIFQSSGMPPLLFSPTPNSSGEDQDNMNGLTGLLQKAMGADWQDKWLDLLQIVPRQILPFIVNADIQTDLRNMAEQIVTTLVKEDLQAQQNKDSPQLQKEPGRPVADSSAAQIQEAHLEQGLDKGIQSFTSKFRDELKRAESAERSYLQRGDASALDDGVLAWDYIITHNDFEAAPLSLQLRALNDAAAMYVRRYQEKGLSSDLDKAVTAWQKVVTASSPDNPNYAMFMSNLGFGLSARYQTKGDLTDLESAVELYERAVQSSSPESPNYPGYLSNLGFGLSQRFDHSDDLADLQRGIHFLQQALNLIQPTRPERASILSALGSMLHDRYSKVGNLSDLDVAISLYKQAVELTPPGNSNYANVLRNLGAGLCDLYLHTGNLDDLNQGVQAYEKAVATVPHNAPARAGFMSNLSVGLRDLYDRLLVPADLERAITFFREACVQGLETESSVTLRTSRHWGRWFSQRAAWSEAVDAFRYGVQAIENLFVAQILRLGKEAWLHEAQTLYSQAAYANARVGEVPSAIVVMEAGRAQLLAESIERYRVDLDLLPQRGQEELHERYVSLAQRLAWLEGCELHHRHMSAKFDLIAELHAARTELKQVINAISQVPGYEDLFRPPTFDYIQCTLATRDSIGAYILVTSVGGLAFVVHANGIKEVRLDLKEDELNAWLIKREGSQATGGYISAQMGSAPLDTQLSDMLPLLGDKIMRPVAEALKPLNVPDVTLIPCGRLALFPLHAAEYQVDGQTCCFMDEFTVTYTPSARALGSCQETLATVANQPATLFGVGNPLPLSNGVNPLAYARPEVEEIAPLFGEVSELLYEQQATRKALDAQLGQTTYLHLSCHGTFNPQDPLKSGVVLSNGEMLTVKDLIGGQRLRGTRLVVLSACQTAMTDFKDLPEEAIGLPGGFVQAGVPGVIGTLWPVNDLSTMLLMVKFYEAHLKEGLAPAAALRQAQLWLRDVTNAELSELFAKYKLTAADRPTSTRMAYEMAAEKFREHTLRDPKERPYAHPYYWAPFVFYGV